MSERREPKAAIYFRNGAALRVLADYQEMRDRIENAEPGAWLEVQSYQDSIDGKTRAFARVSILADEVYRVDEITDEMLTMEAIESHAAAMATGGTV